MPFFGSRLRNVSSVPAGQAGAPDRHRVEAFMAPRTFRGEIENGVTPRARAWLLFVPWPLTDSCLLSIIINFHPTFQSRGLSGSVGRGGPNLIRDRKER